MVSKLNIGWQKYEDIIEEQIRSPLTGLFINSIATQVSGSGELEENIYDDHVFQEGGVEDMVQIPESILNEIMIINNFECWVGHTNFNITPDIAQVLNTVDGVEALKIQTRYRFFIGIGKMFDFSEVRSKIAKKLNLSS